MVGSPLRVFSGGFVRSNSEYGDWGVIADQDAKTISMDYIINGGPYALDPENILWESNALYWQETSGYGYSSERYKDPPDGTHGRIDVEPTVEMYAGSDGLTHVRVTYQLDEINTEWAYDYRAEVFYVGEVDGVNGVWEAFPSEFMIMFGWFS